MNITEWHDFFVATAGAAAALTGLIFVGVSINISKILSLPKLPDRALISLALLLTILIISSLMLIPIQSNVVIAGVIAISGAIAYIIITKKDSNIYRHAYATYKHKYLISIILNQLSLLLYLIAAIIIFICKDAGMYWLVPAILLSFIKAVIDAWVLLVEINR